MQDTHLLFNRLRNLGARPSRARACRLREALNVYAFPAETIVVSNVALTMDGKPGICRRFIEITL